MKTNSDLEKPSGLVCSSEKFHEILCILGPDLGEIRNFAKVPCTLGDSGKFLVLSPLVLQSCTVVTPRGIDLSIAHGSVSCMYISSYSSLVYVGGRGDIEVRIVCTTAPAHTHCAPDEHTNQTIQLHNTRIRHEIENYDNTCPLELFEKRSHKN